MTRYLLKRFASSVAIVLVMMAVIFFVTVAVMYGSGDPRDKLVDEYTTTEQYEAWGVELGWIAPS